jgi:DNA-binding transcriptional ArsR family regulator
VTEAQLADSIPKVGIFQAPLAGKVGKARARHRKTVALLTLRDIEARFGLYDNQVYALEEAGLIEALQRDGKGRVYYSERQIRSALNSRFGNLGAAA